MADIWTLVWRNDGVVRADGVLARVETFLRSLHEFPLIGRVHDELREGLRSCSVPGLDSVTVAFHVNEERVVVLRIGYLGRNIFADIPCD